MRVQPDWYNARRFGLICLVLLAAKLGVARDDRPTQIARLQPRTEVTSDQLHAVSLYATGRALFQRGDTASALRHYQRALRWDPDAENVAAEIVPLAFSLQRSNEAVRYALLSAERYEIEPLLLRRLALYVTETEDWPRAARLYRKWLAHPETKLDPTRLETLLVWLEVGRLETIVSNSQQASHVLGQFQQAVLSAKPYSPLVQKLTRAVGNDLTSTWELCALAHVDAEAFDLAAEALDQIELPLDDVGRLGYRKARIALARNQPLKAWEHLREYFRHGHSSEGIAPFQLLKELLAQLNQSETVILELAKLRAENPNNSALAIALATELAARDQTDQAVALYRSVVGENATSQELLAIAFRGLLEIYADQESAKDILETLHQATVRLGDIEEIEPSLAQLSQHASLMEELAKEAEQTDANTLSSADHMALAAMMLGAERMEDSDRFFQKALSADSGSEQAAETTLAWGLALIAAGKDEQAASVFQQGIKSKLLGDDDPTYPYYLAAALELAGQTDKAIQVAQQAAALRPDSAEFAARIPWISYHAERYTEATESYKALLAKFDDQRDEATRSELRDARFSLSNLAVLADDIPAASEWLETILDEFPDDVGAMNDLGYLWADTGIHARHARRLTERAVAEEPENAAYRDSLGWALCREGNTEAAVRELELAVELSRKSASSGDTSSGDTVSGDVVAEDVDPVIMNHLGDTYLQAGEIQKALRWWQRALDQWEQDNSDKAGDVQEKIAKHSAEEENSDDSP